MVRIGDESVCYWIFTDVSAIAASHRVVYPPQATGRRLSECRMKENLMSGSMWQGMKTRHGDGTEALSEEMESNGSTPPKSRRHPLTLPPDKCGHSPTLSGILSQWRIRRLVALSAKSRFCRERQPLDYFPHRLNADNIVYTGISSDLRDSRPPNKDLK